MEELHCKGTPAQVARRVLAVLAEDPDLLWLIDQYKDYPRPLPKALNELDGRRVPNELENWPVVTIHLHGKFPFTGDIRAEPTPRYTLLTADARTLKIWHAGQRRRRHITEDFSELAPIWEKVKAELARHGMICAAEPAQAEHSEDASTTTAAAGSALEDLLDALAERIGPITQAEQPSALTQALHYRSGNVSNSVIIVGNGNVMGDGSSSRVLQATPAAPDDELISDDPRSKLLQDLDKHFSEEDLRTLCFELGVDYENLPAQGKAGKARELILHLGRVGRVTELIDRCRKLRSNISWEDTSGISPVVDPE